MKRTNAKNTNSFDNIAHQLFIMDENLPPFRIMERIQELERKIENIRVNLDLEEMKELIDLYSVF